LARHKPVLDWAYGKTIGFENLKKNPIWEFLNGEYKGYLTSELGKTTDRMHTLC